MCVYRLNVYLDSIQYIYYVNVSARPAPNPERVSNLVTRPFDRLIARLGYIRYVFLSAAEGQTENLRSIACHQRDRILESSALLLNAS
jgi:hypothetical protein